MVALVAFIVLRIAVSAIPAIRQYGLGFLTGRVWDPNTERYGILAEIWGTVYTSVLALILGTAFGLAAAIFLSEGYLGQAAFALLRRMKLHLHPVWGQLPDQLERLLKNLIELLAAIPSVVYGLWGLFVVIPLIRPICNWLHLKLGLDPAVFHRPQRPRRAAGGHRALDHDPADDHGDQPRCVDVGSAQAPDGGLRTRRDPVGNDPGRGRCRPRRAASSAASCWRSAARWARPWRWRCSSATPTRSACRCSRRRTRWRRCWRTIFRKPGAKQVGVLMYAALVLLGITLVVNIVGALIIERASLARAE